MGEALREIVTEEDLEVFVGEIVESGIDALEGVGKVKVAK